MSSVFLHICQTIPVGQDIDTPNSSTEARSVRKFQVEKILSNGIVIRAGPSLTTRYFIASRKFEKTVDWLQNRDGLLIRHSEYESDSLHDLLKGNGWSSHHASYIAAILEHKKVGIAEYIRGGPVGIRICLLPPWKTPGGAGSGCLSSPSGAGV